MRRPWLGGSPEERSERLLIGAVVLLLLLYAGLQASDIIGLARQVPRKQQELQDARFLAALSEEAVRARQVLQAEVGAEGDPLPAELIEKMKALYTLENEPGKTPLSRVSVSRLRTDLGVDLLTAEFIFNNRDVTRWEQLSERRRNLFEQNATALEPLIVQQIAQAGREAGIEKLDLVKVEPEKQRRGVSAGQQTARARTPSPEPSARNELQSRLQAVQAALNENDSEALQKALEEYVQYAAQDPTLHLSARAQLDELLKQKDRAPDQIAQLQNAALAVQPEVDRILRAVLKGYLQAALAQFPPAGRSEEGSEDAGEAPDSASLTEPSAGDLGTSESAEEPPAQESVPIRYRSDPFPPLVALPQPVQRRLLERLIERNGAWLSDEEVREIVQGPQEEGADQESAEGEEPPPAELPPEAAAIREYQRALIATLWKLDPLVRQTRPETGRKYLATVQFKGPLEQVVGFLYALESRTPWMHATGMRLGIDNPDGPRMNATINLEAVVLP
ncbi:MAG: hypothetical protein KatS3mg115_1532 [Candidatus Poribacteria bacterium]|nr:MAG: hypothetical protein KatS3mg115_1532 [Candidatus Poribacteria bacterium]